MTPDWDVEEAGINGFPALRQVVCGGWLVRISGGPRRTANSATPLPGAPAGPEAPIEACEALYRRHRRPTIFRIPSFLDPGIDRRLAARGYTAEGHSCVLRGPVAAVAAAADPAGVRLAGRPDRAWLAAMARLQNQTAAQHAVYRRIVAAVMLPAAFATLDGEAGIAALAYGVIHRGHLCYESVVTDPGQRRRGHARRVLAALAAWAGAYGASRACLQVEADNAPARALYDAVGMSAEAHRYFYRREPAAR